MIVAATQAFVAPVPHKECPVVTAWAGCDTDHKEPGRVQLYGVVMRAVKVSRRDDDGSSAVNLVANGLKRTTTVGVIDVPVEVSPPSHGVIVIDGFVGIELNLDVIVPRD